MKDTFKYIGMFLGGLVLLFVIGLYGLGWHKFFAPKHANIKREVFEQTKSYTHGKIQDLAKYYKEYQETEDVQAKSAIQNLVSMQFAEFDEKKITNETLRRFLTNMRGF